MNFFTAESYIPFATSYRFPFMATCVGRGVFPAWEWSHIASVIPNSV
jgi:hypothetical protein